MAYTNYPCDVCGGENRAVIESLLAYTENDPIHVCQDCGFVHVISRRTFEEVAADWTDVIFATGENPGINETFTATRPAIRARLIHVLEALDQEVGLEGKSLCDIGAGEGVFLDYANRLDKKAKVFGIEPSRRNCQIMESLGVESFAGTIEEYMISPEKKQQPFDVAALLWTLEDTQDCQNVLKSAWEMLKPGGHLVIGTGSRLLVPFKKPLQFYVGPGSQDTHCFRFSPNSLSNLLRLTGFEPVYTNRYIDNDLLCMIGRKADVPESVELQKDNPQEILDFFARWDEDSRANYPKWEDD